MIEKLTIFFLLVMSSVQINESMLDDSNMTTVRPSTIPPPPPSYSRRPETRHVDCQRVLNDDKKYLEQVGGKNRVKFLATPNLNLTCEAIKQRVLPDQLSGNLKPLKRGVAFARIVSTDYEMIEKQVSMSYHPQNVFCFAIERDAKNMVKEGLKSMAKCFPNVVLVHDQENTNIHGRNVAQNFYNCMHALIDKPGWNYAILLENHDIIGKSVYEIEQIYEWLGGANDFELWEPSGRYDTKMKWDPKSLKLFRNETGVSKEALSSSLALGKGAVQGSLSRAAVEWLVKTVDLTIFNKQMSNSTFAVQEQFLTSFQLNALLGMPGHFTDECLKQNKTTDFITKMSQWKNDCATGKRHEYVCIFGIEDLRSVATYPNIMFHKMWQTFDYAIVECTAELLFNRTFLGQEDHKLEENYYTNMVNVLYHKHHHEKDYKLNCTPSYQKWEDRKYPA